MTEYITVNSNNLITSFVWSGLLDRAKCGELLKIIKMCSVEAVPIEVLQEIRAEIKEKIEREEFARSVFRHEEKDAVKAEQCTGSIMAYNNVIKLIDKYKAESEE